MGTDLSPRERRSARTRQAILDAALQIIREEGADNLSMRGIAAEIDYSAGALYKYFSGKDEIIGTICEEGFDRLLHEMQDARDESLSWEERLVQCGLAYIRFGLQNPEVYRLMFAAPNTPDADALQGTRDDNAFGVLYNLMREGIERGYLKEAPNYDALAMAFENWYLVHGMVDMRLTMFAHLPPDFDQQNEAILRAHTRSIQSS